MIYQYNRALRNLITLFIKGLQLKENTTYRFSADVLGDPFNIYISKRGIVDGNVVHRTPECETWTKVSFDFTTAGNADDLLAQFREWGISLFRTPHAEPHQESHDAYIDNVQLVAVNDPLNNLIEGGTFEERKHAAYEKNWNSEILGLSGKTYGVAIVADPTNPSNHCLKLPKELISHTYPESLPLKVSQFRRCRKNESDMHDYIMDTNEEFLFLFSKKGEIRCRLNGIAYHVTEGMLIVAPPGTEVEYTYCHGVNTDFYYLRFYGRDAEILMHKMELDKPCVLSLSDVSTIGEFIVEMLCVPTNSHTYYYNLSGLLLLLLSELERQLATLVPTSKYQEYMESVIEKMQEQPEIAVSNDALANGCGISKSHFINLFKSYTGQTPKQYRLQELVKKGCVLLETSTMTVQEISYSLGMDDPLYFSRLFRSIQGVSPREYRKQSQKHPTN